MVTANENGAVRYTITTFYWLTILSCTIFEYRDLEIRVRGHSTSFEPFESLGAVTFAFHSDYGAILYRLRDIASYWSNKSRNLYTPLVLAPAPSRGDPVGILRRYFDAHKLE